MPHTYLWAITIFVKKDWDTSKFLLVENTKTGNISFVSGAMEPKDNDLLATARREIKEELNIDPTTYELIPTTVKHEFIFGENKKERAWQAWSYQVFWANWGNIWAIHHTAELKSAIWLSKEEVLQALTFEDLKEVLEKATQEINII